MNDDIYADLKPIRGEKKYVDWDQYTGMWGIFGEDSGFCYDLFLSKKEADDNLNERYLNERYNA